MSEATTNQQGTTPRPWRLVGPFYKGIPGKRNTAAPWIAGAGPGQGEKGSSVCKALFIKPGDAAMIVAAVNACDGMVEPVKEIAELREAVRVLAAESFYKGMLIAAFHLKRGITAKGEAGFTAALGACEANAVAQAALKNVGEK